MEGVSFNIYVPSYNRYDTTTTYKIVEYYTYVVRKSEERKYIEHGIPAERIWAIEDELIDDAIKVHNYIIENAKEDVICMLDDDIENFYYRLDKNEKITDPETVTAELERIGQIMVDLDIGYGSVDATMVPWNYASEFEFKGTSGGMRWVYRPKFKSRFDPEVFHSADLDIVLHELLVNRIILKPKYLVIKAGTDTNKGGNSAKQRGEQVAYINIMKSRWGKYFDYNFKSNKPYIRVNR